MIISRESLPPAGLQWLATVLNPILQRERGVADKQRNCSFLFRRGIPNQLATPQSAPILRRPSLVHK